MKTLDILERRVELLEKKVDALEMEIVPGRVCSPGEDCEVDECCPASPCCDTDTPEPCEIRDQGVNGNPHPVYNEDD